MGSELNILNEEGEVDLSQELLQELDIAIASMHFPCYFQPLPTPSRVLYCTHVRWQAYGNGCQSQFSDLADHVSIRAYDKVSDSVGITDRNCI